MRVFACKDLDGECCIIRGTSEPINPRDFYCEEKQSYVTSSVEAETYCRDLAPGTFRELKRLDVVSGEFEFVEEVRVPTLREAWGVYSGVNPSSTNPDRSFYPREWCDLVESIKRELSKPGPKYDEKLIDELLGLKGSGSVSFLLAFEPEKYTLTDNRRAAEILQALKRARRGCDMNLNEQIEAAWKEQIPNACKWLQCSRESQLLRAAGFGFEEGYRAALRSLYVESGIDELRDWWNRCEDEYDTPFWGLVDGKYIRITARWFKTGHRASELGTETIVDPSRIIRLNENIPSPSEIFGEEGV